MISDTTPLTELAKIGQLTLLRDRYNHIIIPSQVYQELIVANIPALTIAWANSEQILN